MIRKLFGACLVAVSLASSVSATPILIDTLNLGQFPSFGNGNVRNGITNAIASWNATHNPDLPTSGIGSTPDFKADNSVFGTDKLSITLDVGGYNYLFMHWGGPNNDAAYKNPQLYYIGGDTGSITFTAPWNTAPNPDKQYGLSFYSFYGTRSSVPDAGSTLALAGLAIVGLAFVRRKLN